MLTRRDLFKTTLNGAALVALSPTVPTFLARTARRPRPARDGRVLVVIQLDGGNDAINTLVPFRDEGYAKHRSTLRIDQKNLIQVNDQVGLHPGLREMGTLLERGAARAGAGRGLSQPEPLAFREHGDLADGADRPGGALRPGLDRPQPRCSARGEQDADRRGGGAVHRRRHASGRPARADAPRRRPWIGSTTSSCPKDGLARRSEDAGFAGRRR